ncbi:carbohydrate ABC transporter permease [Limnochorda pilosa]|uniref:ABC transporter permease n=1 Tax=Limnochorda pilosa TaxID=1555112 RepID=A0A0K2SMG7_LIMPI|nr:sugar ABC transporter permease [Limnochorda pilosa]BAS28024.1 ABC transporter permease [Limnochorda pilosa]
MNQPAASSYVHRQHRFAYGLSLPYVIFLVLLIGYPVASNLVQSFVADGTFSLENYQRVFSQGEFRQLLVNTLIWTVGSVSLQMILGLAIALLLNQPARGAGLWRALILVLPWATPDIVAGVAWKWMLNDMYGVINDLMVRVGILDWYLPWLGDPLLAKASVIVANTWKGFALSAMFYLAGLKTIPVELYEAAAVDGAGILGRFRSVTLPAIKPFLGTTLMLTIIWTINYFPLIYTMTGGGPAGVTDTFVTYAYRLAFRFTDFARSSALSTVTFLLVFALALAYSTILLRRGEDA